VELEDASLMVRIACIGGFLGAGKTTALLQAARNLTNRGLGVGVVINDQGGQLVDTELVRTLGFQVEEITGGCFCCRFKDLLACLDRMLERHSPDFIFAEAVGSCTDLAATVYRPLQKYYAERFDLAPLSVMVEPARLCELSPNSSYGFGENIGYLFQKQLEEADLIVLNKCDLASDPEIESLTGGLRSLAGEIPVLSISAATGRGIDEWVSKLVGPRMANTRELDLDYDIYGRAESFLGWLNATVEMVSGKEFSPIKFGEKLITAIQEKCESSDRSIAHLKILVVTTEGSDHVALTSNQGHPAWSGGGMLSPVREATSIINARIGASPDIVRKFVEDAILSVASELKTLATVQDIESFSPPLPSRPSQLHGAL
jgi:G3E family GTPase